MCNLYHMAPKEHVQRHFRAQVPDVNAVAVGPFGTGLFLRPVDGHLRAFVGQWGMVQPKAKTRRPGSRAILTNNARTKTFATRPTYRAAWSAGQRCLTQAPGIRNRTGRPAKIVWWRLTRADGDPWAVATVAFALPGVIEEARKRSMPSAAA